MQPKVKYKFYTAIFTFLILITLNLILHTYTVKSSDRLQEIKIVYFYNNPCASCNEEAKFREKFNNLIGPREDIKVNLLMYNVFHISESNLVKEYYRSFNVPPEKQNTPILFLGNSYLSGNDEIELRLKTEFTKVKEQSPDTVAGNININTESKVKAPVNKPNITVKNNSSTIIYFHVSSCSSCEVVKEYIDSIDQKYSVNLDGKETNSDLIIKDYNIAEIKNLELIKKYFVAYGVPASEQKVPIIFMRDSYLSGEESIKQQLINKINEGHGIGMEELNLGGEQQPQQYLNGYKLAGAFLTGFINGFSPCSISMFLFFFSLIMIKKINILKLGFSFISGKFIAFFLLGTLFFNLFLKLNINWLGTTVKVFTLIIVFILIILNIWDYFAAKNEKYSRIKLQLPSKLRHYNHSWIKKVTTLKKKNYLLPVSFFLGMIIATGEFLCTGQVYLATIIFALRSTSHLNMQAAVYFILYDLAFIMPLILITFVIYKGKEIFDISEIFRSKMQIVKIVNAIFFTLFGLAILFCF